MKKTILIPIATSIMCLGALALVPSKTVKVSADTQINSRYFLLDSNSAYGLCPNSLNVGKDNGTAVATYANLVKPIYVTAVQGGFNISILDDNGTRFYAKAEDGENTYFNSDINEATVWTRSNGGTEGKFYIDSVSPARHLGFYNLQSGQTLVQRFGTTPSRSKSNYNYNLTLLPVDEHPLVIALINAIKAVDCSNHNPDKVNDWKPVGDALKAITDTPILNYLAVAPADKNASDTTLEWAMAKYDYVCGKYNASKEFDDYLNRKPSYPTDGVNNFTTTKVESNNLTIIVTVMSLITVASVTSLLFFKRKSK